MPTLAPQETMLSLPDRLLLVSDQNMCQMNKLRVMELQVMALVLGEEDFGQELLLGVS